MQVEKEHVQREGRGGGGLERDTEKRDGNSDAV